MTIIKCDVSKVKHCGSSENFTLIDWYIVIKPSVLWSGGKKISEKMSVDSTQNYPLQQTLKLSLVRPELNTLVKWQFQHYIIAKIV